VIMMLCVCWADLCCEACLGPYSIGPRLSIHRTHYRSQAFKKPQSHMALSIWQWRRNWRDHPLAYARLRMSYNGSMVICTVDGAPHSEPNEMNSAVMYASTCLAVRSAVALNLLRQWPRRVGIRFQTTCNPSSATVI
jgi:hypothetical protein